MHEGRKLKNTQVCKTCSKKTTTTNKQTKKTTTTDKHAGVCANTCMLSYAALMYLLFRTTKEMLRTVVLEKLHS